MSYFRLAPFLQEYLYAHGWTGLRPMQEEACRVLFDTEAHLLVAAGTASGKTEAAFLPVLTLLHEDPPQTVGALYISPIKALINDQFDRLTDLLQQADIPVWAWHGDVAQSQKKQLLKQPKGILQLTPESLESLLINKTQELPRLFGDLRFVVIDEIHAFIGSDRGAQILCQLSRLARLTQAQPRRIGLSATLGDYSLAEEWLRSGTTQPVITPQVAAPSRTIHLALEHFYTSLVGRTKGDTSDRAFNSYHLHLYQQSLSRKCLIFANGRSQTEAAIACLREIAIAKGSPDVYHVHHGSVSAQLREVAENAMRHSSAPTVTAATVTFEMGIDLGQLDRVIQLEAPGSVSSFLQRLGRSGRRGSPADMRFVCAEDQPTGGETLPEQLPWQLLQCIAVIQLYLEEKWIEPIQPIRYPLTLLYQQTLSVLLASGELAPAALAQQVLTLPPFRSLTQDDFRHFLRHLLELNHLQSTPENGLIIGLSAERIVHSFKFYATFADVEEYTVQSDTQTIGCIVSQPSIGDRLSLAGRTWEVLEVNPKQRRVRVQLSTGTATMTWHGSSGEIHPRVLERMQQALLEDTKYSYLQAGAQERLQLARSLARHSGLHQHCVLPLEDNFCCIFPWTGTIGFRTLERYLRLHCREALKIKGVSGRSPYFLVVNLGKCSRESLLGEIKSLGERRLAGVDLLGPEEVPKSQKYDEFMPPKLLRQAFATDRLCLDTLRQSALVQG
ncbi:MAG TPA: DEAD/DEAH box helicase [Thermosynechococcaceae cyanobacterium]